MWAWKEVRENLSVLCIYEELLHTKSRENHGSAGNHKWDSRREKMSSYFKHIHVLLHKAGRSLQLAGVRQMKNEILFQNNL